MSANIILSTSGLKKSYFLNRQRLEILRGITIEILEGESLCITGVSGAGKSTLLHILGGLDTPTEGQIFFDNRDISHWDDEELAGYRSKNLGFVFQFHHLLKEFNAIENVAMPARIAKMSAKESRKKAEEMLELVGLTQRSSHFPNELSGGEQQRVAVARALIQRPRLILADEPTGNLDSTNSKAIQDLFFTLKKEFKLTLVVVTHDKAFASQFPRTIVIKDGLVG